jgi:hypothetical protein
MAQIRCVLFLLLFSCAVWQYPLTLWAQTEQPTPPNPVKTPIDIQFTLQMSRSEQDFQWSQTYYNSYKKTLEIPYLDLAAEFCHKAIVRLAEVQKVLSRITRFYNQADQKKLQACQFYDKLQRASFLLESKYHLGGSGADCQ